MITVTRKAVIALLALIIILSICTAFAESADHAFIDVPKEHWAYDEIQFFYKAGIVAGMNESTFAPDANVTREQFAKLLTLIFSNTDYVATEQTFSDVTSGMWSYNYIEAVKQYLTGYYPAGAQPFFNPAAKASREDIAYSLVKIIGLGGESLKDENVLDQFSDSNEISPALKKYIGIAVENGLILGYDGKFRPQDGITRAETVVLLFRALKAPVNGNGEPVSVPASEYMPFPEFNYQKERITIFSSVPLNFSAPGMNYSVVPDSGKATFSWGGGSVPNLDIRFQIDADEYSIVYISDAYNTDINPGFGGIFEIKKNGAVVANVEGEIYGSVGCDYFKFYSSKLQWHYAGYITDVSVNVLH